MNVFRSFVLGLIICTGSTGASALSTVVEAKISEVWVREYGLHLAMTLTPAQLSAMPCGSGNRWAPALLLTDPNFKSHKDVIMMAVATGRSVRLYIDDASVCVGGPTGWPKVVFLDLMSN